MPLVGHCWVGSGGAGSRQALTRAVALQAAPPVGALRFQKPQPVPSHEGVMDCTAYAPRTQCVQHPSPLDMASHPVGEDSLFLNIYAPTEAVGATGASCPVLFWIHGGGFQGGCGADPLYDGAHLARRGAIVVTVNYRLGVLGFLPVAGGPANVGIWDQVEALKWVQHSIGAFGGDRDNVTILGESAGAACVMMLMASPTANKLFHRAIPQSGVCYVCATLAHIGRIWEQVAVDCGAEPTLQAMQELPWQRLLEAQTSGRYDYPAVPTPGWQHFSRISAEQTSDDVLAGMVGPAPEQPPPREPAAPVNVPCIDGDLLPAHPLALLSAGVASHLSVLIGSCREEMAFAAQQPDEETGFPIFGAFGTRWRTRRS